MYNPQIGAFTCEQISRIVGADLTVVQENWAIVFASLEAESISDKATQIAAIATIAIEAPPFKPINEYGNEAYFTKLYEGRRDLGNVYPGDGALFHGRGYIQITGRANYQKFGRLLGLPLETDPELALEPNAAAKILSLYFSQHGVARLADQSNWLAVRKAVNGGMNGWSRFSGIVDQLNRLLV